jgi:hypothetical protein
MVRICLLLALALGGPAIAKPRRAEAPPKPQKMDFDDDVVEGGVTLPQMELVSSARHGDKPSLIRVRTTFVPELLESARQR